MTLHTLDDVDRKEFYRLLRVYKREARRCEHAGAFLAGCVMLGSALETMLVLMVDTFADEAKATGRCPRRGGTGKRLLDWTFVELLRVAQAAKWLPTSDNPDHRYHLRRAKIGDFVDLVRQVRNLAHPTRYREDHFRKQVTARILQRQFDLVEISMGWLMAYNNNRFREWLNTQSN
jgi:hypothetical protein